MMSANQSASRVALCAALLASPSACNRGEEDRPPYPDNLGGESTFGGFGGEAANVGQRNVLRGRVVQLTDSTFATSEPFEGEADVGAPGEAEDVEGVFDGESFEVEGAQLREGDFVSVRPRSQQDVLGTFTEQNVDAGDVELPVVAGDTLDGIFDTVDPGSARDPTAGQLLVRTVDESGDPVAGVGVEVPGAEFLGFSEGGAFQSGTATGADGLAFAANVPSSGFPGGTVDVTTTGSSSLTRSVPVASGMVTVVDAVVTP